VGGGARLPVGTRERAQVAAAGAHLWAWERHCPWNVSTTTRAAAGGHPELLQWAREQDCPWDESNCRVMEVLRWAREHGGPDYSESVEEED